MRGSLFCGKILGIKLYVHWTFLLIFLYIGYYSYQAFHSIAKVELDFEVILVAFAFVIMHEYGHALAARRVGIMTRQILILPIGGMAQLDNMPEKPKDELFVTFCGPAVNLCAVLLLLPVFLITHSFNDLVPAMEQSHNWLATIIGINLILFVFNLIPAFPMDGGRIFRALLAFKLSYPRATLIAARTGQAIAIGVFGYFISLEIMGHIEFFSIIKLLILCVFIVVLAGMEYRMVKRKKKMGYYNMPHIGLRNAGEISMSDSIAYALYELSKNGKPQIPIMANDKIAGVLTMELPDRFKGYNENGSASNTWKTSPSDTLGHALKMMEILGIPLLPLDGSNGYYLLQVEVLH